MRPTREMPPATNRGHSKKSEPTTPNLTPNDDFDFDQQVVAQVDKGLWEAIFAGDFRLAVPCSRCGRWLTAGPSKRARCGAHCAAKAGENK
jgi:hypothetical protein